MIRDTILLINQKRHESFLRTKLPPFDLAREDKKELRELVKRMREVMKRANGVGLSANQIGVAKRLFVAQVPDHQGHMKFYAVANPVITKFSKETTELEEGCLSVPETYGAVERPERITLEGYDLRGKKIKIKAWGILARVFQHEIDHLNGTLFIDKCKAPHKVERE